MTLGYAFSTQLRGVRQISPGNVVKPTGSETGVGAGILLAFVAVRAGRGRAGGGQPVQRDVVDDVFPGEIARGLSAGKGAGDLLVAVRIVIDHPRRQRDG